MTALKAHQVPAFVERPDITSGFVLIYGTDRGLVHEQATRLMRYFGGADGGSDISLDMATLTSDPERLAVEARTASLFGGKTIIRIRQAGNALAPTLEELLADWPDAIVIAEAENLTPKDKLRALAEKSPISRALPCYADTEQGLAELIRKSFAKDKFELESGVVATLSDLLGNDREVTRREIEKLKLFADETRLITVADVLDLCGDNTALAMDLIIDSTATGHVARLESALSRALTGGINPNQIMTVTLNHFTLLRQWRAAMQGGASVSDALKTAWPRPHFSRTKTIEQQLRLWNDSALGKASERLYEATRQMRTTGHVPETLARRALLAVCILASQI